MNDPSTLPPNPLAGVQCSLPKGKCNCTDLSFMYLSQVVIRSCEFTDISLYEVCRITNISNNRQLSAYQLVEVLWTLGVTLGFITSAGHLL